MIYLIEHWQQSQLFATPVESESRSLAQAWLAGGERYFTLGPETWSCRGELSFSCSTPPGTATIERPTSSKQAERAEERLAGKRRHQHERLGVCTLTSA